jgi:dihydrofolate synthase/folylpolyglutamate synthase|tara:strand:+ start:78 stop:1307 length:1230 start_codon:yes stop_codon:yes gene_type:complete
LHPKEIDLSLDRIKTLCKKLGNPQDKIKAISVVGTNGKNSIINAIFSILKEANFNCNVYTSPHILRINERFIFDNKELDNEKLADLFEEVENINDNKPITLFEILTASYFYKAAEYPKNINLIEAGLFHRFDATNILKENLASVTSSISKDHLDWLKKDEQTIEKIVFEKTSSLLNSNIIVAKQSTKETMDCIKKTISKNPSNKLFFNDDFNYSVSENDFFHYEDKLGGLKLPIPNVLGQFQLENISTAIATLRTLDFGIKDEHFKNGITKISSLARLQEIRSGKLKKLVKNNKLIVDGSHNEDGARVLNEYLQSLDCNKHVIVGMMANKEHEKYISYFKNISSITTIDLKTQPNSISGKDLKEKFKIMPNVRYQPSIEKAIKSINLKHGDLLLITGSLYGAAEVLNLN